MAIGRTIPEVGRSYAPPISGGVHERLEPAHAESNAREHLQLPNKPVSREEFYQALDAARPKRITGKEWQRLRAQVFENHDTGEATFPGGSGWIKKIAEIRAAKLKRE